MDEHDIERMLPGWQATSEAVARELVAWREAHPRGNLTQIEDAVAATSRTRSWPTFLRRTASLASSCSMSTAIESKKLTYPSGYRPLCERDLEQQVTEELAA